MPFPGAQDMPAPPSLRENGVWGPGWETWLPWATTAWQERLTQLVDANLLQILPCQVRHDGDGIVAIVHQLFVVLGQPNGTEPVHQVSLERAWSHCHEH